jgi:hypothetical protein
MSPFDQPPQSSEGIREQKKQEYIALAKELSETNEKFPFPGIDPESYQKLKAVAEKFSKHSAQIDELIERFQTQGMRVALSKDPNSGNVFILPFDSVDTEMDSLFPRHLAITEGMDKRLKKLILANRELKNI